MASYLKQNFQEASMVKMELIEARENVSQPFTKILRSFYMFIQDSRYLDIYSLDYSGFYTKYPPSCSYVLDHLVSRKPRYFSRYTPRFVKCTWYGCTSVNPLFVCAHRKFIKTKNEVNVTNTYCD